MDLSIYQKVSVNNIIDILYLDRSLNAPWRSLRILLKSRGPILSVTSSETRSVCVKQSLNTRRWLVNALVEWHVSYKVTTLHDGSFDKSPD